MAQRKSLLEEIREQNSGASFNQQVVDTAKKSYTVPDVAPVQHPTQQQGQQRTSLLQEIIDSDGMGGLNQDYAQKALDFDGGFGAIPGGYIKGEDGNVYMHDYSNNAEILRQRAAEKKTGGVYKPEDMSFADQVIDRILGVDRTQVTGEKTNWWQLLKGSAAKGINQWNASAWKSINFLLGGFAEEVHNLGLETVNGVIDGLNMIPGVNLDYVGENSKNLLQWAADDAQAGYDNALKKYGDNANSSRAAQIVDTFGTSLVAAVPMAIEAFLLAPVQAAQAGAVTTQGLQYFSGLQSAGGLEAAGMMAKEGLTKLVKNPQFWTSYLQVAGDGYEDALADGMSEEDAATYGLVNGFFNAMVEIGGADEALGGIQNLPMRLEQMRNQQGKKAVVEWFKDAVLGEGKEEVLQGVLERGLKSFGGVDVPVASLDPTDDRAIFNPFTAAGEFTGGAVVGLGLGGGQVAVDKAIRGGVNAIQEQARNRQTQQTIPTELETGTQYVQQVVSNMEIPEAQQRILMDGLNIGDADPQTYAHGIQEAFQLGEMGLTYEQAVENSTQSDALTREQFQHAWEIGAQKSGHSVSTDVPEVSRRGINVPDFENIEEFSRTYPTPEKITEIFDQAADVDVNEFAAGFRAAYDMGQSGVSASYLTEANVPTLTDAQRTAAYQLGQTDAEAQAVNRDLKTASKQRSGNLQRVKGTVRGEGVTIADMRTAFNDRQNTAYRLLTKYAETTGVNIVLYNSQADSTTGLYPEAQGRFQWKDDSIYIDINSGLNSIKDVNSLGNYTMLRTFAHEFTHFIEKWNAAEYNEFRQFVFDTLESRGENVHDLIESMQARDTSGNMTYEQASREVVADAMMDILPDSNLVQQLASEHQNIFRRLLQKLREFTARMKQYYREISSKAPREAQALKENNAYMDGIVQMWDRIAKGAVANYQGANGEVLIDQPAKPDNLPKRSAQQKNVRSVVENAQNAAGNAQETGNVRKRVGMDFFRTGEYETVDETAPVLKDMVPRKAEPEKRRIGRDYFPANDFTSQAEEGPDLKSMVPKAAQKPAEAQEEEKVSDVPVNEEKPAEEAPASVARTPEGEKLFNMLSAVGKVTMNGYEYAITAYAGRNGDTVYNGRITKVSGQDGVYPVENAHNRIFDSNFATREEAVDDLVGIAENNRLLEEVTSNESTEITEPEAAPVSAESDTDSNGDGAVRVSSEQPEGAVQRDAAGREPSSVPSKEGRGAGRSRNRDDAKRNGRSRSEGNSESGVQPGREPVLKEIVIDLTPEEQTRQKEELHEETVQQVEQKSTESAGGNNYQIGESLDLPSGSKARYKANVEAIRIVKQLEAEGRTATAEEQAALARYVGWGGIPEAFDERKTEWSKEFAELKELLTDEEYKAAKGSTLNAHYTSIPVIRAMYRGLEKLGFKGGRMLEPSSGVGNFVGAMPANMTGGVKSWTMVELDNITGLIAKHLYPQNDVRIEGFENTILPDGYMDVAIGNVPFGNYPVVDRAYPKKITSAIHNYFFAKSLDKVRTGGIVMFITSSYTMNANDKTVRSYISKKADLLGAIRLPNTAFSGNAGTSVVTDILILKKRAAGTEYSGVPFVETEYDYKFGYQNEYFKAHPDMVLGEQATSRGMHYRDEYTVNPFTDRGSLEEQIDKAFQNITGKMDYPARPTTEKANINAQKAERGTKQGGYVQKDGKIYQNDNGILVEVEADEKTAKRITGMLGIRDIARQLMNAQQQGTDEKSIKDIRRNLNKLYDSFVKEYGYLNSPANKKAFQGDPDRFSLFALENWDAEKKTATKADIFTTDTIKPNQTVTHAETVKDGLAVSRNTTGGVDVPLISRLTGKSEADVIQELIEGELAFKTKDGSLEPAETYLSGNVRAKLRDAQGLVGIDKDFQHNVDALKAIVPADIPHEQIFVQPGTPWIPESVYSDFAAYILGGNNHRYYGGPDIAIHRSNQTGNFTIDLTNKRLKSNYQNTQEWGTPKRSFLNLLEAMMNSRSVTVTYKDAEGHTIVDRVATDAANEKIEQITKKFQEWLWEDAERAKDLEYLYNETFNNLVTPKYDGGTLTVNGLRAGWGLRPHQADAVQRIVSSGGNTLLAHRVGAGKTLEMAAAAMKLKELGIVQKPMFAVPKSLVAQWGKEFSSYFPAAKLLVAEQSDFTPNNRKTFANRISTGNYDAIIVSYEQFEKIPISDQFALSLYQEQVEEIIQAIKEAKEESGAKSMSVKDMEKKRKQLEAKIQKLSDKAKDTDSIEFEQLGIDSIFVDEAHNFKNLFYTTSMNNVAGLGNKDGSKRAFDLYTKVRYLQQLNGGRGVVFATATPVMNSMSEMYIMQKYLQPDLLDQLGLSTFDAWAKQFGEVVNGVEIKPSGQGYRVKQSFSRFKNMSELQLLFRNFSDVLTQVPGLKIPKMKGGAVKVVECEAGEFQQEYMKQLEERADNIKNVDPSEDNMLKITSDGRKISYTQRMIDPSLPYEEGCKLYKCAENIAEEYKASKDVKGTQIVFCDMATPKGKSNVEKAGAEEDAGMDAESTKLYDDLKRRLVKLGIPAKEIAFIHDADTDAKKSKLFDDVNAGSVRVLIGSTGKMGVGMNAQKRAVAIHHLDAPWRPGDVEQRDGRVFRQGNINEEVSKYVYVTTGSFDARLWDIIDRKSSFIDQIMNGENVGRDVEDTGEVTLSAAEVKALASGSPLILEQVQLETDIKKLQNLYMAHRQSVVEAGRKLQEAKREKAEAERRAANARKDVKNRTEESTDDKFSITVGNKAYKDKKEAGKVLMAHAAAKATEETYTKIGTFAGFDISVVQAKEGVIGLLKADGAYKFNTYPDNTTLMITNMQKVLNGLETYAQAYEETAKQKEQEIKAQETLMQAPFPRQEELDQKRKRYNEVMEELNPKEEQAIDSGEDEDNVEYSLRVRQEFSSAKTSLNQVAALFKSKHFQPEDVNIDIGGGAFNATTEYLAEEYGTTNMVYDPYNRGIDENLATLDYLRTGNRADTATCANVLNVIKEQESRRNVILEVAKSIKEDGTAYFSVYEKDKSGTGVQTGADQWQNSRATADYVHEIEEFFDNVERKGAVIIATNPKENLPSAFWRITEEEEIEYSTRRNSGLSDREVLSMAANDIDVESLSDVERNALSIFNERLTRLQEAQEQRAELGRQYKDQQFTKGGSRQEADRIRAAMSVLDSKIKSLENSLLSLENKDVLKTVLQKARRVVEQEEKKRGDENLKRYRERRNESAATRKYRDRVRMEVETLRKWLVNPSNKDMRAHVPAEIQKTVANFLESINLMSKTALRTSGLDTTKADEKYLKNMKKMRDAIKANVDSQGLYSGYADLPEDFIENFNALISKTEEHIKNNSGQFVVNEMSAADLKQLSQTLKTLKKYITTMNMFHNNAMFQHTYEAGEETVEHLSKFSKSKKSGLAYKFMRFDYMRPSYAFEHFGKGGQSIEHEFREGQATQAFLANKIIDFAKKTYTGKEVKAWGEQTKTFELSDGETVTVPITHLMSLYCLNKRPQALTHIYGDGIRVANYKNGKNVELDEGHLVTLKDVQKMIQELTPRQMEVADALQKYMSTETAAWGNYVSMARFDVEQFTEENYFPINSDGRYLSTTADESPDNAGLYALLNSSFTKELKENASNRIILYNIFDVFANHTASMTQYRAFALPMLDALKWFNYKNDDTSVRTKLSSAFGAPLDERAGSGAKGYAEQFVINLLKAYNGTSAQGDPYDSLPLKMLHHFNGAAIAYNLRVIIQQPTAITRAAMILSPAKLTKGLSMSTLQMNKLAEEMEAHSGIAAWKALGFYDTNISRGLTDLIKQNPGVMDRVMEVGTKGAELADRYTWAAMWYAAKDTVRRSDYKTEEEYFKAVTDLFEDVIYKTQVVDSLLTKAQFLRSKGGIARQMGSFMSEPSATMSMLTDAHFKYTDDIQQGMSRSEAWQRNGGNIAKTIAVYAIGQVILSGMQAVIDAWRDQDDEDSENWLNNYLQKYLKAFKGNVVEEEMIFGKIPLVSELYELMKKYLDSFGVFDKLNIDMYGNDVDSGMSMYTKYLTKAIDIIAQKKQGKGSNYTPYSIIYNLIKATSNLSGIPFATAWREVQDVWNNTVGYFDPSKKLVSYQRAVDKAYSEYIQPSGMSQKDYQAILDDADTVHGDSNGKYKQDEVGAALVAALEDGRITEEQANAVWRSKWHADNNKTFEEWRNGGKKSETAASSQKLTEVQFTPAAKAPAAAPVSNAKSYDDFKKVPVYDTPAKQTMYGIWETQLQPSGMSLDRFIEILNNADTDGNDSIKQDEMGVALMTSMQSGELTFEQCDAIWRAQWNKAKSKTFAKWMNG
ncbi:MAG: DEAD/DEAH box helicase family protein [Treponema sp.]|nr:DEAD/DEAH box helicase family protein [Candidatus Treponema caballi]